VTFDKTLIPGKPQAELIAPGHPPLDSVLDVVLERFQPLFAAGRRACGRTDEFLRVGELPELAKFPYSQAHG
jgi:hypothetical protein